jgi:3-(3-hydroxy-phenyl)propionate hydroxylase
MTAHQSNQAQVVVVGGGPNGVTFANLLGQYGIPTLLIEKAPEILPYPRAVGMDDEALRLFQSVGLADDMIKDMIQNVPLRLFKANGECFANIRPSVKAFGWWRRNIFMQQLAERTLRDGLSRFPHVEMRLGHEVLALAQDGEGVTLTVRGPGEDGPTYTVRTPYVVAADGGRSPLREMLNVPLLGTTHPIKWLVVDVRNAHVASPCTALNCDPRRPNVNIYLPYNFRRWEFLVFPHEDADAIAQPESVRRLLAPYVDNPDEIEIVRSRTYTHHSRVAERFVVGRVALIGDAAHLTPPWVGQGLNAGLRDVGNLAWKLAGVLKGQLAQSVIETYESERRRHARAMIDLADAFGAMLMPTSRVKAFVRDAFFGSVARLPGVREYVLQMRFKPMPSYEGPLVVAARKAGTVGTMFIQPDVEDEAGQRIKFDDALGDWFAVVGWECDPQERMSSRDLAFWRQLGARFVRLSRSRSGAGREARLASASGTVCLEDVDNALADWFEARGGELVVLRPDRYVAMHGRFDELPAATRHLQASTTQSREVAHAR